MFGEIKNKILINQIRLISTDDKPVQADSYNLDVKAELM